MNSPARPIDTTPPDPWDSAGKWLAAHYQFTNAERDRVKGATRGGQPLSDPRLREAVCGLAWEVLANRTRMPGIVEHYVLGTLGLLLTVVLALATGWPHGHHEAIEFLLAAAFIPQVISEFVLLPRRWRKQVAKAWRVNGGTEGLPAP